MPHQNFNLFSLMFYDTDLKGVAGDVCIYHPTTLSKIKNKGDQRKEKVQNKILSSSSLCLRDINELNLRPTWDFNHFLIPLNSAPEK